MVLATVCQPSEAGIRHRLMLGVKKVSLLPVMVGCMTGMVAYTPIFWFKEVLFEETTAEMRGKKTLQRAGWLPPDEDIEQSGLYKVREYGEY